MRRILLNRYALAATMLALGLATSYGWARAGEPQAQWLWCAMLGLC